MILLFSLILLPLFSFICSILFSNLVNKKIVGYFSSILIIIAFFNSLFFNFLIYNTNERFLFQLGSWIKIDSLNISWLFYFDALTGTMLLVVTSISAAVHLYSCEYMSNDPHLPRFISYLSLFTFFMFILISAGNFLQMFIGWEGVGLSSYLLINFWYTRIQANKAAIKAMLINRIGDFFMLLAIILIFDTFETLDYLIIFNSISEIFPNLTRESETSLTLDSICFFLFLGAMGKSAQLGLHVWLPDAMEGPTPVSALIHAATMVTAGVFLIIRCSFLFEYSPLILNFVMLIGSTTTFFGSTTGLFQNDLKKIIAYSTCSQLGYMIFACGLSNYHSALFHLSNHAFFKALLFLVAGSIIHSNHEDQDLRNIGGFKTILPLAYLIIIVGSLALSGFPFLTGFFSKDIILESAISKNTPISLFCFLLGLISAFFTAFYSTRIFFLIFLSKVNNNKVIYLNSYESSWKMTYPILILSILSLFIGFFTKDIFSNSSTNNLFWENVIFIRNSNFYLTDIEFLDPFYKILPFFMTVVGMNSALFIYLFNLDKFLSIKQRKFFILIYSFFNKKWYFDRFYTEYITQQILFYSYIFSYKDMDRGLSEIFGPKGIQSFISHNTFFLKKFQTGTIFHTLLLFAFFIFLQLILVIFI